MASQQITQSTTTKTLSIAMKNPITTTTPTTTTVNRCSNCGKYAKKK